MNFVINGVSWWVQLVPATHSKLRIAFGEYALGACDSSTRTIYIRHSLNDRRMKKVLCHEIAHAAMFSYGVELSQYEEEVVADILANYGFEIITITDKIFNFIK